MGTEFIGDLIVDRKAIFDNKFVTVQHVEEHMQEHAVASFDRFSWVRDLGSGGEINHEGPSTKW
jgi:hypothetical protein